MTPYESEQLCRFLHQLREARVGARDADADRMIRDAVRDNPDAAYLLVQRTMLLEQALNNAKTQIAQLQQQRSPARDSEPGGFLGRNDPWATGSEAERGRAKVPGAAAYQAPSSTPASGPVGGGSSFLGNLATTAAGVVAGSFLFRGIEHLLGHQPAAGGFDAAGDALAGRNSVGDENPSDNASTSLWSREDQSDDFLTEDLDTFGDDPFLDGSDDSSWV